MKKMDASDPVRDFLRQRGCPDHVIKNGLRGLIENWEEVVESVARSYRLGLDDYLNDLDGRQLLEEVLVVAPKEKRAEYLERLRRVDERMKTLVEPAGRCLWGDEVAESEGWTAGKNWWYFSKPIHAGPELLSEIENA